MNERPIACSLDATDLSQRLEDIATLGREALIDIDEAPTCAVLRFAAGTGVQDRVVLGRARRSGGARGMRTCGAGNTRFVVRWRGRVPASVAAAGVLRGEMEAVARQCGLSEERAKDVKLAVSEAVTNAVQHAYRDREPGDVWATASVDDEQLQIVIADGGVGMTPRTDSPGLGLGLPLISHLADSIQVLSTGEGTEIHMTFPCPAGQTSDP
jgi:anti-sigma regulatory factor (Ser/Thr protein kinase)